MSKIETTADFAREAFFAFSSVIFERTISTAQELAIAQIFATDSELEQFESIEKEFESGELEAALVEALYYVRSCHTLH